MLETEAKVRITVGQFKILKKRLDDLADFQGTLYKRDSYFGDPKMAATKRPYLRLRKEGTSSSCGEKTTFAIKVKKTSRGVERNLELEWGIANFGLWKRFLASSGLLEVSGKEKKTELYHWRGFNIELNHVVGLGHFLEIEKLSDEKRGGEHEKDDQKELIEIFRLLGFPSSRFEKTSYLSLLKK